MVISPNFVRNGAIRCILYSTVLLSIGGYWSYENWMGWHEGVLVHLTRGGRLITTTANDPEWYLTLSFRLFGSSLTLLLGLRYILIFAMPKEIRNKELSKLVDFYQEKISVPTRAVVLVALFFTVIASIPLWR
jgi:hypothetical protein